MGALAATKKIEAKREAEFALKVEPLLADIPPKQAEQLKQEAVHCCSDCAESGRARFVFSELRQMFVPDICSHRLVSALLSDSQRTAGRLSPSGRLFLLRSDSKSPDQIVETFRVEDPWEKMAGQFYHERVAWREDLSSRGTLVTLNAPGFVNVQLFLPRLERWEDENTKPSGPVPVTWG